jgi:UDP-GlcNAc:undecaprenyl-phosphate/decaprenyl-phosphate GlcNAc-1-phosphate transferase
MVQRVSEGRSPFSADKNHIHHRLLALGFDHHEAVMVIYAIQADLFLLVYWTRYESDLAILALVSAFFIVSVAALHGAARRGWRFRAQHEAKRESWLTRVLARLCEPSNLPRWSYFSVASAVAVYAALILAETASMSSDVRTLLMGLLALSVILFAVLGVKPLSLVEKGALYTIVAVLVYLDSVVLPTGTMVATLKWCAIGIAALGTILRLRLSPERRFVLTPLDLIVLFTALVVPSLPGIFAMPHGGAIGIAKLVILFYAIEVLVSRVELGVVWLRIAATALLAGLVLRPFTSL